MSDKTSSANVKKQLKAIVNASQHRPIGTGTKAQEYAYGRKAAWNAGQLAARYIAAGSGHGPGIASVGRTYKDDARAILTKKAERESPMDREIARAVIEKWDNGEAVSEKNLYKAASALGIDPMSALVEARFFTYLDNYLLEKRAMSRGERAVFSAAAGIPAGVFVKTASAHGFTPDELILEALRDRGFVPSLQKIANLAALQQGGPQGAPGQGGQMPPGMDPSGGMAPPGQDPSQQAGAAMMAPPQDGAMLQQQPDARFKPSPTAPEQVPASAMGNLDDLIGQGQQIYGDQAMQNGGTAPQGMPEPAPPPPSPEERIQQVGPNLDPETVSRYAEQLQRFEEGFQMQISDPKQMVKFVKELQKVDGKKVDQGIKAMGQQLEQEQAQELGVDATPTIDGPGGAGMGGPGKAMAPKAPPPQGGEQDGAPQGGPAAAQSQGDDPSAGAQPPGQQAGPQGGPPSVPPHHKKPPAAPPQDAAQAAVEKVANAARALARASFRA